MYLIISDTHFGLSRKTGVTPASLEKFESDKVDALATLLEEHSHLEVIIAGDLFDSSRVSLYTISQVSSVLFNHPKKVWVIAGNHDLSKDTTKMSSLLFMSQWLDMSAGSNVQVVFEPTRLQEDRWGNSILLVPHMPNQPLFDEAINNAVESVVITHCNFENGFAVEKDHSLNLTKAQAKKFKLVLSGHEHNARKVGNVHMLGAFAPCNVGEAAVVKQSYLFNPNDLKLTHITNEQSYAELHWSNLFDGDAPLIGFLKIIGEASAAEAPKVLTDVAKFRKTSGCYMIQNAVTVESIELGSIEGASFESVDTLELLGTILSDEHKAHLEELGYVID